MVLHIGDTSGLLRRPNLLTEEGNRHMSSDDQGRLAGLFRYPIKGLTPQALDSVDVLPGATLPGDRIWALENGGPRFDERNPEFLPKVCFLMLMSHERLAGLKVAVSPDTATVRIERDGDLVLRTDLSTPGGRRTIEGFFQAFMGEEARGPIRLLSAPGHSFSDVSLKCVHIINLATVRLFSSQLERKIDPARFRANLHVDGFGAREEETWVGRRMMVGNTELEVVDRTERCMATNVDPDSARRDMTIPDDLDRLMGHRSFGIYAKIIRGGTMSVNAPVSVSDAV